MTEIRAELAVADAADPDASRPLDVDDFKVDRTGAGKETTQSAIKTVLEAIRDRLPAALSGGRLKTEITQAAGTTVLVESAPGAEFTLADTTFTVNTLPLPNGAATENTLDALLAKVIAGPSTAAKQDAIITLLTTIDGRVDGLEGYLDGVETALATLAALQGVTYGYAASTGDATVDVPADARVRHVTVIANLTAATTVTIAGGNTITIPAGGKIDLPIHGKATLGGDVVIGGGDSVSYYVAWATDA